MSKKLILRGRVQGVFCRAYCKYYANELHLKGSASNLGDGTVQVLIETDNENAIDSYINLLLNNPSNFSFFGRIVKIEKFKYSGIIKGDYIF